MPYCVTVGLITEISYSSTTIIALGDGTTRCCRSGRISLVAWANEYIEVCV